MNESSHSRDEDCALTLGSTEQCVSCGVSHAIACDTCHGRGFHRDDCAAMGGNYGVTLRPDHTGDLDSWGTLDHWLAVGAGGRPLTRDEQHAVIDAVKAAAAAL